MSATTTETKTCAACANWNNLGSETGECRAKAPQTIVLKIDEETKVESRFPVTKADDWCGEFVAK
ncbi:MAG: hypothetical protein MI748_00700 [Opitutales bacterium]|nr:hypothetical protein [Opitutales bacterium]